VALVVVLSGLIAVVQRLRRAPSPDPEDGRRDTAEVRLICWALPWAVLPAVLVGGYAMAGSPLYSPRYFSFCTPAAAILVGLGLVALRRRWLIGVAVTTMLVLAAPVYVSQRQVTAKSGTDWSLAAAFVGRLKGPDQAVYFAPRYPTAAGPIERTLRSIRVAYPGRFTGLRDLTETGTPAATSTLTGISAPLTASTARLTGMNAVWVIRRNDYPALSAAEEDRFLNSAGFRIGPSWRGPLTTVQEFRR
jgi:mannosyltransferase